MKTNSPANGDGALLNRTGTTAREVVAKAHGSRHIREGLIKPYKMMARIISGSAAVRFLWAETLGRARRFVPTWAVRNPAEAARRQGQPPAGHQGNRAGVHQFLCIEPSDAPAATSEEVGKPGPLSRTAVESLHAVEQITARAAGHVE